MATGAPTRRRPGGKKVCFALSKPKSSTTTPPGRKRDPAFLFVSTRPAENVRNEVSVIIGYPFKESTDATAEIGTAKFAMYTQKDGAWIKNVAEEARMLDAMRKGADLTVKGTSGRGTSSHRPVFAQGAGPGARRARSGVQVSRARSARLFGLRMIRVGIGGWVFEPWRGVFYPKGLPQARELAHASRNVTSIEINGTFYAYAEAGKLPALGRRDAG